MSNKKSLILFSTNYVNFKNDSKKEDFLFEEPAKNDIDVDNSVQLKFRGENNALNIFFNKREKSSKVKKGELNSNYGKILYLKNELIFCHSALGDKGNLLSSGDQFITAFLEDVAKIIEKKNIDRIYLFLHRGEIITESGINFKHFTGKKPNSGGKRIKTIFDKVKTIFSIENANIHVVAYKHHSSSIVRKFLTKNVSTEKNINKSIVNIADSLFSFEDAEIALMPIKQIKINRNLLDFNIEYTNPKEDTESIFNNKIVFNNNQSKLNKVTILFCKQKSVSGAKSNLDATIKSIVEKGQDSENRLFHPIIFITPFNLFKERQFSNEEELTDDDKILYLQQDPRRNFLDSSIWFRTISIEENEYGDSFEVQINKVLDYIEWAYKHDLYNKNATKEHRNLHRRLFNESYLENFGSHASAVVPFKFHSETKRQWEAEQLTQGNFEDIKWDFLLVDDFAERIMRPKNKSGNQEENKNEIIREIINRSLLKGRYSSSEIGYIEAFSCQSNLKLEDAEYHLKERADIIFLDYLFSQKVDENTKEGIDQKPQYGTELLHELKERPEKFNDKRGVYEMFWFFPVTVFPDAFASDMQDKKIPYINENYYVARGADPINTPYLFRSELFQFMNLQIKKSDFTITEVFEFLLTGNQLKEEQIKPVNAKSWAKGLFGRFIERFGYVNILETIDTSLSKTLQEKLNTNSKDSRQLMSSFLSMLYHIAYLDGYMQSKDAALKDYKIIRAIFFKTNGDGYKKEDSQAAKIFEQIQLIGQHILAPHNQY